MAVTNSSGTLTSQQRYLPFGGTRAIPNSPILATDFTYTGQRLLDSGMGGIMDYKARFYSPALMRFLQPDTVIPGVANPQNWNRYLYANNNPIRYTDPSGHWAIPAIVIAAVVVILKVIDYGWTAYDTVSSLSVALDSDNSPDVRKKALGAAVLAVGMELLEPDELSPVALPLDDIVRHGDDIGNLIFRKASGSPGSLTPRPGIDDLDLEKGGLSFFDSIENMMQQTPLKKGDKYVQVDPKKLDGLEVIFDNDPLGHVSVRPPSLAELKDWAISRGTGVIHKFTEIVKKAVVGDPIIWK